MEEVPPSKNLLPMEQEEMTGEEERMQEKESSSPEQIAAGDVEMHPLAAPDGGGNKSKSGLSCSSSSPARSDASSREEDAKAEAKKRQEVQECRVVSELSGMTSGLLPLQLGAEANPARREGFSYVLDAPTSGMVRRGEDTLTYLNKDQFYPLAMEFVPTLACPEWPGGGQGQGQGQAREEGELATSVIMLQFRERKEPQEALAHWEFWHARQHAPQMRLIDVDAKASTGVVGDVDEIAHNAVMVKWDPRAKPATLMVAIRCLSTDFSSQKGVKGIPLHIQVDTYRSGDDSAVTDRAFLQIKTFCDKGAERKAREEEKRLIKHGCVDNSGSYLTPVQPQSTFQKAFDLVSDPILYQPKMPPSSSSSHGGGEDDDAMAMVAEHTFPVKDALALSPSSRARSANAAAGGAGSSVSPGVAAALAAGRGVGGLGAEETPKKSTTTNGSSKCHNGFPAGNRVLIYARQDNEEIYTPLHVAPPTVQGLIRAISAKYQIDSVDIRFAFRETKKGIVVKIDDDMIKYYCNGDAFIMKVLATEETASGHVFYDVVFTDPANPSPSTDVATSKSSPTLSASSATAGNGKGGGEAVQQQQGSLPMIT